MDLHFEYKDFKGVLFSAHLAISHYVCREKKTDRGKRNILPDDREQTKTLA